MILQDQSIIDLTTGSDRRIIQEGDSQVTVPSTIIPVALTLKPTQFAPAGATLQRNSCMKQDRSEFNNNAQSAVTMLTLGRGVWELEYLVAYISDFKQVVGIANLGVKLTLVYKSQTFDLMIGFVDNISFTSYGRCRVLFEEDGAQIRRDVMATGVAERLGVSCWVNAIKII